MDWEIRSQAAAYLELAGWADYAAAFRALPQITGPGRPTPSTVRLFRAAFRATDKASTAAAQGIAPYKRRKGRLSMKDDRTYRGHGRNPGTGLVSAARGAVPSIDRAIVTPAKAPAASSGPVVEAEGAAIELLRAGYRRDVVALAGLLKPRFLAGDFSGSDGGWLTSA